MRWETSHTSWCHHLLCGIMLTKTCNLLVIARSTSLQGAFNPSELRVPYFPRSSRAAGSNSRQQRAAGSRGQQQQAAEGSNGRQQRAATAGSRGQQQQAAAVPHQPREENEPLHCIVILCAWLNLGDKHMTMAA